MKQYLENRLLELNDIASQFSPYSNNIDICKSQIVELERALDYLNALGDSWGG